MPAIWLSKGDKQTEELGNLSINECEKKLGMTKDEYVCDLANPPRFGNAVDQPASAVSGYRYVVVEISAPEATASGWKSGFYVVQVTPKDARKIMKSRAA
jgi:hypothetical protein